MHLPRSARAILGPAGFLSLLLVTAPSAALPQQGDWQSLSEQFGALYQKGQYRQAIGVAERALRAAELSFGPNDPRLVTTLNALAVVHNALKNFDAAQPYLDRALGIAEKFSGPDRKELARVLNTLGMNYNGRQRFAEAQDTYERALGIAQGAFGPKDEMVGTILNNFGQVFNDQQRYNEAGPYYERALEVMEDAVSPWDPRLALTLNNLAFVRKEEGGYDEAMILYERSLGILERALGEHVYVAAVLENLAKLYDLKGWKKEAAETALRARRMRARIG